MTAPNLHQSVPPLGPVPSALQDGGLASNHDEAKHPRKPAPEDEGASKSAFAKFFSRKGTPKKQIKTKKKKSSSEKVCLLVKVLL
jgi:hypothetical protein